MAKLDEGFEEVPVELDKGFEETSLDDGFKEVPHDEEPRGFTEDKPSQTEATARSVGQGLTFGLMDELAGGAMGAADVATSDKELKDLPELYRQYRDMQRERDAQSSKDFPKTSIAGEIAGSIPTAFTPMGASTTAAKSAKLAGLMGLGKSEADLTKPGIKNLGEAALDTGSSALMGKYAHKGADYLGRGLKNIKAGKPFNWLGDTLQTEAEDTALGVLGTSKKALEKEMGGSSAEIGYRRGMGEKALENIKATGGPQAVREKTLKQIDHIEETKKPLIQEANDKLKSLLTTGNSAETSEILLNEGSLASQLNKLKDKVIEHKQTVSTNIGEVQGLSDRLSETVRRYAGKDNDIFALNEFKKALGKEIGDPGFAKKVQDLPEDAEFLRRTYSMVNKRIEELANKVSPELGTKIRALNMEESNLIGLRDAAFQAELSAVKNTGSAIGDAAASGIGATIGATIGGPVGAAIGGVTGVVGKKGLEKSTGWSTGQLSKIGAMKSLSNTGKQIKNIGETIESSSIPNAIARPLIEEGKESIKDEISNAPMKLSQNLYQADEQELDQVASTLESDPQYQKYGEALKNALAQKSNEKKKAALFSILQNPNMRKLIYGE